MPLVPGGMLYRTMENFAQGALLHGISENANSFSKTTMSYALGIAVGISLVYSIQNMINRIILIAEKRFSAQNRLNYKNADAADARNRKKS